MTAGRPRIVHVSADFPDPLEPAKTPVIRALLELTQGDFAHHVISLNRRAPGLADVVGLRAAERRAFDWGEARIYRAPPFGLLHHTLLRRLGARLAKELSGDPPALVVGHKLTIEGLVVAEIARRLAIPYAVTIQGNSDGKILAARPDLRDAFAQVFQGAAAVFAFAPWALAEIEQRLGKRAGACVILPCPTDLDTPMVPFVSGKGLISAFHLRHFRNKNLSGIAAALRLLRARGDRTAFTLVGAGDGGDIARCENELRGISSVCLAGGLDREALQRALNGGTGFVLASHRESFGLVFIEALFAGLPIVYPQGRAVAGWFDDFPFAIPVDPRSPACIAAAMGRLVAEEAFLKQQLAEWQMSDHARQFTRTHIAARFALGLQQAVAGCQAQLPIPMRKCDEEFPSPQRG